MVLGNDFMHQEGVSIPDGRYSSGCDNERVSMQEKQTDMEVIVEETQ